MIDTEKSVFEKIREDEQKLQDFVAERRKQIEQLKHREVPERDRMRQLKAKAKKAEKFLTSPGYAEFEEYLTDLSIECQIRMRELGLSGKSSEKIGDEVIRLSIESQVIDRILNDPKELLKMLK